MTIEERRSWPREPVIQPALLLTPDGERIQGRIRDFCPGGMFVETVGRAKRSASSAIRLEQTLRVFFKPHHQPQRYRVSADVVRMDDEGAALRFKKPHEPFYRILRRVAAGDEASAPLATVTRFNRDQILLELAQRAKGVLTALAEHYALSARQALRRRESEQYQDEDLVALRDAAALMRELERAIITALPAAISRSVRDSKSGVAADQIVTADAPFNDQPTFQFPFDHAGTTSEIAQRGEARFPVQLFELRHRLALIYGRDVSQDEVPVAPAYIVRAFGRALQTLPLSVSALHALYATFDEAVVAKLDHVYDEMNQVLISHGIAPIVSHGLPNWMPD